MNKKVIATILTGTGLTMAAAIALLKDDGEDKKFNDETEERYTVAKNELSAIKINIDSKSTDLRETMILEALLNVGRFIGRLEVLGIYGTADMYAGVYTLQSKLGMINRTEAIKDFILEDINKVLIGLDEMYKEWNGRKWF
jgi:hypothetical protein